MADTINLRDYLAETQPRVLDELRRCRLLRRKPAPVQVELILVDGLPYRDVTEEATASAVGEGAPPGHATYQRRRGALRQVRSA